MTPLLETRSLRFAFPGARGFSLVCDDLTLAPGEFLVARGGNGQGKSVLLRLLAGLLKPTEGRVVWFGGERAGRTPGGAAGFAPPLERGFHARLTARENLRFFGRLQGVAPSRLDARAEELASALGALERIDTPFGELSSGFRQRFNLARSLLHAPRALLLDEPERGLDGEGRERLRALLSAHLAAGGAAIAATPGDLFFEATRRYRVEGGRVTPDA